MGFVSLRFHNASASTRHQRPCDTCLSKNPFFLLSFFFRNAINLCVFRQKHTLTPYRSWRRGWGKMPILFSLLRLQTSCSFGTFPKAAHRVVIGANCQIVIAKPKLEPIMTKSLGVAEDFGPERGQPLGFHVGPIWACNRFYPWESNYRFWDLVW